jgi:hypothetical protein
VLSLPNAAGSIVSGLATDHMLAAAGTDAVVLLLIPALWILGVVLLIAHKFRTR